MTEISDLERRLSAALARIGAATDMLRPQAGLVEVSETATANPEVREITVEVIPDEVKQELETLRADLQRVNDTLVRRDQALKDEHGKILELQSQVQALTTDNDQISTAFQACEQSLENVKASNEQLRASNADLRAANAAGVGDASAINAGTQAALDSLQADRDAEKALLTQLMSALNSSNRESV